MPTQVQVAADLAVFPQLKGRLLVVFDGKCGFCNQSIRWLLRRDRKDQLRFAPSSSPEVETILERHGIRSSLVNFSPDTIMVLRNFDTPVETLLVRSNAVLACLRALPQPWPAVAALARVIPRPIRESMYRMISRWRYRIWGRYATCPIPTSDERRHFL